MEKTKWIKKIFNIYGLSKGTILSFLQNTSILWAIFFLRAPKWLGCKCACRRMTDWIHLPFAIWLGKCLLLRQYFHQFLLTVRGKDQKLSLFFCLFVCFLSNHTINTEENVCEGNYCILYFYKRNLWMYTYTQNSFLSRRYYICT